MYKIQNPKKATLVAKRNGITLTLAFGFRIFGALTEAQNLTEQGWQTTVERHL